MFLNHTHWVDPFRYKWELDELYAKPVSEGKVLFYGSSTFRGWDNIRKDIHFDLENHSFGGSATDEALFHYPHLVLDYKPSCMVWYFGDNDFVCQYSVDEIEYLTHKTWANIRAWLPELPIVVLATKICPARHENAEKVLELNRRIKDFTEKHSGFYFVDVVDFCKKDGQYDLQMFKEDQLHFTQNAYDIIAQRMNPLLEEILK